MAGWAPGSRCYDPTTDTISGLDGTLVAVIVAANGRLSAEAPALVEVLREVQELGVFLLTQRSWSGRMEELVRQTVQGTHAVTARVLAWAPP